MMPLYAEPGELRLRERPACPLCGGPGQPVYKRLHDRLCGVPGEWAMRRCSAVDCRLLWLDPAPVDDDLLKTYVNYHTHDAESTVAPDALKTDSLREVYWAERYGYRRIHAHGSWRLRVNLYRRMQADMAVRFLPARPGGNLLDVGCGRGDWLAFMAGLGWRCEGVEPDPAAAEAAERQGVSVHVGGLPEQQFPDASFDAVSLCHVIEHVPDPREMLSECKRILKPGGRLVVITPNGEGLGARVFGADWRGLEPPRHLQVFNRPTLRRLFEQAGLEIEALKTVTASRYTFQESWAVRNARPVEEGALAARLWVAVELAARAFVSGLGETVVAVARA